MKRTGNITFGAILLLIGVLLLLRNLGLLDFHWADVFRFWYVSLIIAGVMLLISGLTGHRGMGAAAGIFIALGVIGGVTRGAHRELREHAFNWRYDSHPEEDTEEDRDNSYSRDRKNMKARSGEFAYDMEPAIKEATFHFEGGAGEFRIGGETTRLFEASTRSNVIEYVSNIQHLRAENKATVNFGIEKGDFKLNGKSNQNEAAIKLNPAPVWDFDLSFAAGDGDFDLTNLRIRHLQLSTGAADVKIKLGDKNPHTDVSVEAGAAAIKMQVPESSGVEIHMAGILNSKDFEGFEKVSNNLYRTPGFNTATRKIVINCEAGISSFEIKKY